MVFYLVLLLVAGVARANDINATEIALFNPSGSLGFTTSDILVTTDTIGVCKTGDVNNAQRLNVNIGMSVTGATQANCNSFALGETFTLGHNSSDYLNLYDTAGAAYSSNELLFPGVTSWVDTKLLPNNERWVTCGGGATLMFSINTTSLAMVPHQNSTLAQKACIAAGAVGTDVGEDMFTANGTHIDFASLEDRDDDQTNYVNDQTLVVSSGTLQSVSAAYNNVIVFRLTGSDGLVAFYHDGSQWVESAPFAVGVTAINMEVAKNDGTVFLETNNDEVNVYKRVVNDWEYVGNFTTLGTIQHTAALSLEEFYYADASGNVAFMQLEEVTAAPTESPTPSPTDAPSGAPTVSPSASPTVSPSASPTVTPTTSPSVSPSTAPTMSPTSTSIPTTTPTPPTNAPTEPEDDSDTVVITVAAIGGSAAIVLTASIHSTTLSVEALFLLSISPFYEVPI